MLFSRADLEDALRTLVNELVADEAEAKIQVVGGAAVALQVGRESLTVDIDALGSSTPAVRAAATRMAASRNWPETWINDAVKMYMTHLDTDDDWELWVEEQGVIVLVARPMLLLAMKLLAGRGRRDGEDIDRLLDACEVTTLRKAQEIFDRYFPTEVIAAPALAQLRAAFREFD